MRFKFAKYKKRCFNCLKPNHSTKQCNSKRNCFIPGCDKSHHTSLHSYFSIERKKTNETNEAPSTTESCNALNVTNTYTSAEAPPNTENCSTLNVTHTRNLTESKRVYLKTVPVRIISENGQVVNTYAFLDDGSEGTFVRQDLANLLKMKGKNVNIKISTIVDGKGENIRTKKTTFTISGQQKDAEHFIIHDALVLPGSKFHAKALSLPSDYKTNPSYAHLQKFDFKDIPKEKIQILIGTDNYNLSLISDIKGDNNPENPVAVKTPLGWSLFGKGKALVKSNQRKSSL